MIGCAATDGHLVAMRNATGVVCIMRCRDDGLVPRHCEKRYGSGWPQTGTLTMKPKVCVSSWLNSVRSVVSRLA
jgi:hypothetical protein